MEDYCLYDFCAVIHLDTYYYGYTKHGVVMDSQGSRLDGNLTEK